MTGRPAVIAVLLALGAVAGRSGVAAQELRSSVLRALADRSSTAAMDSVDTDGFWREVAARRAPLVEPLPGSDSVLVTFLWRGGIHTRNALVFGDLTGWLPPANEMRRMRKTDVWHLSVPARPDVRIRYRIAENDSRLIYWSDPDFADRVRAFRPDPLNPDTIPLGRGQFGSWMEGPAHRPDRWTPLRQPRGGIRDTLALNGRDVVVYAPATAVGAEEVGVVVALDGGAYDALASAPATVEALASEGTIRPVVLVLVEHEDRNRELPPNEPFVRFVADTLFPAVETRWPVSRDPARSAVVGSSLGGLAAVYLAFRIPERIGAAVAQSGAYWWSPPGDSDGPWLSRLLATSETPHLRVYLDAGTLETQPVQGGASMLRLTQQLRDVLCARGDEVAYRTFPAGHAYEAWRQTLPDGLAWTLGGTALPTGGGEACARLVPKR